MPNGPTSVGITTASSDHWHEFVKNKGGYWA